jgi:hypothetical protein
MTKRTDETGLRPIAVVAAGMAFWVVAAAVSGWTLRGHPESAAVRGAMVALGVAGFLAWLIPVARLIMLQDEFSQRIHLVAIALACGATAVLLFTADLLQTAGFLGWVSLQSVWVAMGVLWWLGIFVATRYYNR